MDGHLGTLANGTYNGRSRRSSEHRIDLEITKKLQKMSSRVTATQHMHTEYHAVLGLRRAAIAAAR